MCYLVCVLVTSNMLAITQLLFYVTELSLSLDLFSGWRVKLFRSFLIHLCACWSIIYLCEDLRKEFSEEKNGEDREA